MTALELIAFTESERMYLAAQRFHERQALIDQRSHRPIATRKHQQAVSWIQRAGRPIVERVPDDRTARDGMWR